MIHPGALIAVGTAFIASSYGLARFTYGLFSPDFATEFTLSPLVSGILGSGSFVGYCIAIVVATILTPRWGARRVAVLAGVTATVGIAMAAAIGMPPRCRRRCSATSPHCGEFRVRAKGVARSIRQGRAGRGLQRRGGRCRTAELGRPRQRGG
jgi:MFS family permease